MTRLVVRRGGPHGRDIVPGNIYREDGTLLLVAKEHFPMGANWRPGVFFLPDGTEPEPGVMDDDLADFWNGRLPFYQDEWKGE